MSKQHSSGTYDEDLQVCEMDEELDFEQSGGNQAANESMTGGDGDDTDWWKTVPKLEVPWPPGAEKQSKHEISWENGPAYQWSAPPKKWPSDGREELFKAPPCQIPTPVPGVVLDLFAGAEWGLSFGAAAGVALKKQGEGKYSATGKGSVTGKAEVGIKGGVGVGLGGGGVSVGVSGDIEAKLEAALSGSIEFSMTYNNGAWSGAITTPLKFETAVKVTPSASLYVNVWGWRQDMATLTIGEWTIATVGAEWTPGLEYAGGWQNTTSKPTLIGPTWGSPPEATEA
jgi:hypothetical protein